MRTTVILTLATAALAAIGAAVWTSNRNSQEAIMLDACEKVLLERLRSPSTYQLIEASDIRTEEATEDDYLYNNDPAEKKRTIELHLRQPELAENHEYLRDLFRSTNMQKLTMVIEYDAENGFGTPIRGRSLCAVFRDGDDPMQRGEFMNVRIDGKTSIDWAFDGLSGSD